MQSVLITGAAGFIGSHLTERCLAMGWRVTAVDAFTDYYDPPIKRANVARFADAPGCTLIAGDLLELDLNALLGDVSVVFHLAAQPGVRASWDQFDVYTHHNLKVTQRLLAAAATTPVQRLVIASSSSIYGDAETLPTREDVVARPVSPYGVTKLAAEQLARIYWQSYGVPVISLRYFTVYGPRQRPDMAFNRLITCALADAPFNVFGDGEQTRDFTYVADAVAGTISAGLYGEPGAAYNIGGGSRRSVNSVLETLERLLGRKVGRNYVARQVGDARDTGASIDLARSDLGFSPVCEFEDGLRAQLEWQLARAQVGSAQ